MWEKNLKVQSQKVMFNLTEKKKKKKMMCRDTYSTFNVHNLKHRHPDSITGKCILLLSFFFLFFMFLAKYKLVLC